MPAPAALILGWARSAVAPRGGAFACLQPHEIAAPVIRELLARARVPAEAVDAVVAGNALGAGGNPARMAALAAGLGDACAAHSVDSQCCAGLDAVGLVVGLLCSGQAGVVVAGGVEAWSRAPLRAVRPLRDGEPALPYERPPFSPDPQRDPDLLRAAAEHAWQQGHTRAAQDAYALASHERAVAHQADVAEEIVTVAALAMDSHPRLLTPARASRIRPLLRLEADMDGRFALSPLAVAPKADGAAFVLLASPDACRRLGLTPRAAWRAQVSLGGDPAMPLRAAERATRALLARAGGLDAGRLHSVELHDAFATQGLGYGLALGIDTERINRRGGGLARGHPIGASGAVALVRVLADLQRGGPPGALGLAAVAAAGGLGSAALVEWLRQPNVRK